MASEILSDLNPMQREAVETVGGPLLIIAGPGSGKTRVITQRIAHLIDACGVSPWRIAAMTFTNKAASEMRERAQALVRTTGDQIMISTFHSFCARTLRSEGDRIGINRNFAIYDRADQISALKRAMADLDFDVKQFRPENVLAEISKSKSKLIGADGYGQTKSSYFEEIVHRVYAKYEELLDQSSALDFDDLLLRTHTLFRMSAEVLEGYRERYIHVMIDEFQDTNTAQYQIATLLAGRYRNLCVVGDPDQSIYSWRNADVGNMRDFQRDYPDVKVVSLGQNYRSTETIVKAADSVIASNRGGAKDRQFTENAKGAPIVLHEAYDQEEESRYVIREIERLAPRGVSRSEVAVMYRVNAQSRAIEEACLQYEMPYHIVGSIRFYQRQEIRDVLGYLRLIANHNDDESFRRVVNMPARGIGRRTMDELLRRSALHGAPLYHAIDAVAGDDGARIPSAPLPTRSKKALLGFKSIIDRLTEKAAQLPPHALITQVLELSRYRQYLEDDAERAEERLDNVEELRNVARGILASNDGDALTTFLERVSLVSDADNVGERADAVTLITLHQAKGLEFRVVFIVGMEERLLPHSRAMLSDERAEIEEERRLCYVGMTRAKEWLYLVRAFRRGHWGEESGATLPSRFLADIPHELIEKQGAARTAPMRADPVASPPERAASERRPASPPRLGTRQAAAPVVTTRRRRREAPASEAAPIPALKTGDRVRHRVFGEGIVTSAKEARNDIEVIVAFTEGHGVKRMFVSAAPIEKVEP